MVIKRISLFPSVHLIQTWKNAEPFRFDLGRSLGIMLAPSRENPHVPCELGQIFFEKVLGLFGEFPRLRDWVGVIVFFYWEEPKSDTYRLFHAGSLMEPTTAG